MIEPSTLKWKPDSSMPSFSLSAVQHRDLSDRDNVLIVENEAVIALDIAEDLQNWSYTVIGIGRSLIESVEIAERFPPAWAIVDVALGAEHDGIAVGETLKSRFGTRIIFLTAYTDQITCSRIVSAKPSGYLLKPYSAYALRSMLQTFEGQ